MYVQVDYIAAKYSKALISQSIFPCLLHLSLQQGIRETDTREQNYSRNVKEMGKNAMEEQNIWRSKSSVSFSEGISLYLKDIQQILILLIIIKKTFCIVIYL